MTFPEDAIQMRIRRLMAALLLAAVLPLQAAEQAGMIKIVKGSVYIERSGQKIAASVGTPVMSGDRILTGPDGSVGITLSDDTLLSSGPRSVLDLSQFAFNAASHAGVLDAFLKRGSLAVVSGLIAKHSPEAVKFRTPSTILGVRGTEFVIRIQDEKE
jgi:hypothetical protein